ncbi:serine/threonine protein kinase [Tepiditoga spiralis]|uniref:Serine/threonine protein kinase n=1 Tax=Tepiditoga spiralis TaxID=2108365 RepID=A0A7G1G546_9BACT|nr:CBS domain-containing protein [Tepiditoga spiralis]BBE31688.1 serine/threonine protein kinase [Tepiditoga spiralis]
MNKTVDKLVELLSNVFSNTKIKEIMSTPPIVVTEETKIKYAKEIMRIKGISGMPVVNKKLELIGILSIEDLIKVFENGGIESRVLNWMTKEPFYLSEEDTIRDFLDFNQEKKFGRYPVLNRDKKVVGVVTKLDIMEWLFKKLGHIYIHDERRKRVLENEFKSIIINEKKSGADFSYEINYNSIESIGMAATKLKKFLLSKEIDSKLTRKISIATYEAEANVVIHSGSTGHIYCYIKEDFIKIYVEDFGKGIECIDKAMKEGYSTASETIREKGFGAGMGLPNMKRFSNKMTVVSSPDKGLKVEMIFFRGDKK